MAQGGLQRRDRGHETGPLGLLAQAPKLGQGFRVAPAPAPGRQRPRAIILCWIWATSRCARRWRARRSWPSAFSNTKTALAHALSYPITLDHGVPHGIACSFSLPLVMRAAIGVDADCDAALQTIFGPDLEAGAAHLSDFLAGLGVSVDPADHGVAAQEWRGIVGRAFSGERGKNYVGTRERVESLSDGAAAAR